MTTWRCNSVKVLLAVVIVVGSSAVMDLGAVSAGGALILSPLSGPIGTKVTVCGSGMTPGATIPVGGLTFDGQPWSTSTITIDSLGKMCATMLMVPSVATGKHTVVATDTGGGSATGSFTITQPKITILPKEAYKGETVTVTGTGWVAGAQGQAIIGFGATLATAAPMAVATPDANGYFSIQFTVPLTAVGTNWVTASDILGNTALPQTFLLKPALLTLSLGNGPPGTTVKVTGKGFQPQTLVSNVGFGIPAPLAPAGLVTGVTGSFETTVLVPGLAAGDYEVSAKVAGFTVITCCFTITEPPVTEEAGALVAVAVNTALSNISDYLVIVWGWSDADQRWLKYDPYGPPALNTLQSLEKGEGYWIKVTGPCTVARGGWSKDIIGPWKLLGWLG